MSPDRREQRVVTIPLGFGGMVNSYLILGERPILVDTGIPGNTAAILKRMKREGVDGKDLSLIFLTHTHFDHSGSAAELGELTGAPIAVPRIEADRVRSGRLPGPPPPTGIQGRLISGLFKGQSPETIRPFEPDIVHDGDLDLAPFGIAGQVVSTPGHSPGHAVIVLESGEIIAGDTLSGGLIRRTKPMLPYFAEDLEATRQSARLVAGLARNSVYVGHGGPLPLAEVRREFGIETAAVATHEMIK